MVQAVILAGLEDFFPRFDVGGRIAGEWEIAAEMRAAEINWVAVQDELVGFGVEVAKAESCNRRILLTLFAINC